MLVRAGQGTANEHTFGILFYIYIRGGQGTANDRTTYRGGQGTANDRAAYRAGQGHANKHTFGILFYVYIRGGQGTANDHTDCCGTSNLRRGANVPACLLAVIVLGRGLPMITPTAVEQVTSLGGRTFQLLACARFLCWMATRTGQGTANEYTGSPWNK